jgi:hypothetical protein
MKFCTRVYVLVTVKIFVPDNEIFYSSVKFCKQLKILYLSIIYCTRMWSYVHSYEIFYQGVKICTYSGMKFCTRVWKFVSGYEILYRVWHFVSEYEFLYKDM